MLGCFCLFQVVWRVQSLQVSTHLIEVVENKPSVSFFREQLLQFDQNTLIPESELSSQSFNHTDEFVNVVSGPVKG